MSFLFEGNALQIPQGFLYNSATELEAKIIGFKQVGIDQLQVVLDFDRTLTIGQTKNRDDSSSWQMLKDHLPPEGQARVWEPFNYYRSLEVAGELTAQDASDWWSHSLDLMMEYNLDIAAVEKDFLSKSTIRPGAKELFELCSQYSIPTIILSAGVKEVIEIWAKTYDIHPTIILATSLQLDQGKRMIGWDKSSLVHVLNKKEIGHPELSKIRSERSHTILVGDSMHDFDMAEGQENVLRVRIYDPRDDKAQHKVSVREQTLEVFDTILEDGTFEPITELIKDIAG